MAKSRSRSHSKRRSHRSRRVHRGGAVIMPSEYFGGSSGRYGDVAQESYQTAYGPSNGVSQGTVGVGPTAGPNLAYGPTDSKLQTGGRRRRSNRRNSKKISRRRRSNRKH